MFFQRRARPDARTASWQTVAAGLGLIECDAGEDLLADSLDLNSTPLASTVWQAADTGAIRLYAFDFLSDSVIPGRHELMTACLLLSEHDFCPVPLRMERQLRSQLAGFRASASMGLVVLSGSDDGFDEQVTVVAREVEAARGLLGSQVREATLRLFGRSEQAPSLSVSGNQLLAQARADGFRLQDLEYLLADLMALYVALDSRA